MISFNTTKITSLKAREILSSNGNPSIEVIIQDSDGRSAKSAISFGASAGTNESFILLDRDTARYHGNGMLNVVENVNKIIAPEFLGKYLDNYMDLERLLLSLDSTPNKSKLGGNSILGVSISLARLFALFQRKELYKFLQDEYGLDKDLKLPAPIGVCIEGGRHGDNSSDIQEYAILFTGDGLNLQLREQIRLAEEFYMDLKKELKKLGKNINIGSEGAFVPELRDNFEAIDIIERVIESKDIYKQSLGIYIDAAASEWIEDPMSLGTNIDETFNYKLQKVPVSEPLKYNSYELLQWYTKNLEKYKYIKLLEDPFGDLDWKGWEEFEKALSYLKTTNKFTNLEIVTDDLTVTNPIFLQTAIEKKLAQYIIIKPNQIGSVSETINTGKLAIQNNWSTIVSHRGGGESNDDFIADLAVALQSKYIKCGLTRGERVSKYNRLMEIEN